MARRGYSLLFATGLFFSDIFAIVTGYILAFYLRFFGYHGVHLLPAPLEIPSLASYIKALPFVLLILCSSLWAGGLYRESLAFRKIVRIGSIIRVTFLSVVILVAFSAFYRDISFSRVFIVLTFPCFTLFICSFRWLLINVEYGIRKLQGKKRTIIIVGDGKIVSQLTESINSKKYPDYQVLGYVSLDENKKTEENLNINNLGMLSEMEMVVEKHKPDEIIFATVNIDHQRLTEVISLCDRNMMQFYIVPDILNFLTSKVELTSIEGINLIGLQKFPLDNGFNRLIKRVMDLTGAILILAGLSWLFVLLGIFIKLTSKGAVFYKQVRCHEDGKEFDMYKFRTMYEDAEHKSGPVWAKAQDDRCTKIGRFMRSANLDELPQVINVLKGDMSLVGPRPERPHFISKFKFDIPRYMARHSIKPGITGWAQVNGWRGNTSLEERIKYDIYYIENWSIWLDIKILFLTFFSFKNAY